MLDALICDFDGVIVDTETPDYETWRDVFLAHGADLDRGLWSGMIGSEKEKFDVFDHLEAVAGLKVDRDAIAFERRERYLSLVHSSPIRPGVYDYLKDAGQIGLRLGVASSSQRAWVEGHLEKRGLLSYFECVVAREDVAKVKPDPEVYVAAIEKLGTSPSRAVAIEDSLNGVIAAKQAGMSCVAVPNPMTADMAFDSADYFLEELSEIRLGALLAKLP